MWGDANFLRKQSETRHLVSYKQNRQNPHRREGCRHSQPSFNYRLNLIPHAGFAFGPAIRRILNSRFLYAVPSRGVAATKGARTVLSAQC
jgi:hypothetical protein